MENENKSAYNFLARSMMAPGSTALERQSCQGWTSKRIEMTSIRDIPLAELLLVIQEMSTP